MKGDESGYRKMSIPLNTFNLELFKIIQAWGDRAKVLLAPITACFLYVMPGAASTPPPLIFNYSVNLVNKR